MNVNEMKLRLMRLEEEASAIRARLANTLPKPLKIGTTELIARPHAVDVEVGETSTQWSHDNARDARDWLVAAYPLDTAPHAGWVSVDDRLPEAMLPVLVGFKDGRSHVGYVTSDGTWINPASGSRFLTPTHWRELPEPPSTKGTTP